MISIETRKFILKLILVFLYADHDAYGCTSNKQLYTEIGCKPIYNNGSAASSCPTAYDCENVFTRSSNKCYFNGNVYEPPSELSETDSKLSPCLAACSCRNNTYNNNIETKFTCAHVECPSFFNAHDITESCYYQYNKDSCCEINKYCPEEKSIVHECVHDGKTYKDGQRFYVGDYLQCVCSPKFNGTVSDKSCKKVGCNFELLYMRNIVKRNAPVYFENVDGCPIDWYNFEYDFLAPVTTPTDSKSAGGPYECKYGDLTFAIGQNLTIGQQTDLDTYETTCSCNIPPLVTCVKVRKVIPEPYLNTTKTD